MRDDRAPIIPLHLHPGYQDYRGINELKNSLLAETLAFVQVALDNANGTKGAPARATKILERARELLGEARDRLVLELL